jgi:transcriptional regulator with XRE-family HTH domain
MWMKKLKPNPDEMRDYERDTLRAAVVSLFWNILAYRKKERGFTLSDLAAKIGVNKSAPSRWFGDEKPNWTENTMADIAAALDVELEVYARDRKTGIRFASYGPVKQGALVTVSSPATYGLQESPFSSGLLSNTDPVPEIKYAAMN